MNEWDMLVQIMQQEAMKSTVGKVVDSEGRTCSKCGKPCTDAGPTCLAKGFEIFACNTCEPNGFARLQKNLGIK
jgi:hypothetical protein